MTTSPESKQIASESDAVEDFSFAVNPGCFPAVSAFAACKMIMKLCRLCLREDKELVNLTGVQSFPGDQPSLKTLIRRYLSIEEIDCRYRGVTIKLCTKCAKMLKEWHIFYQSCVGNDKKFRQKLVKKLYYTVYAEKPSTDESESENENVGSLVIKSELLSIEIDEKDAYLTAAGSNAENMNVEDIVIEPEFLSTQDNRPDGRSKQNADKVPLKSRIKQNEQEACSFSELEASFSSEIAIYERMSPKVDHLLSKNDTPGKSISNNPDRTFERQLIRQADETQDVEVTCERRAMKRSPSTCSSERLDCETVNQHGSVVTEPEFVCLDDSVPQENVPKITLRESKSNKRPAVSSSTDNPRLGTKKAVGKVNNEVRRVSGVCHICGVFRKNLSVHMSKHNGERKFKCPHCPAAFTDSGNCKQHINIHTREKIYKCDLCDKEYTSLNVLRNHKDSHSETKKHVCKTCGNAYQYRPALKRHMKTHTEDPKIKCPECEMRFYYKGRMLLHLRKHYEPEFACEICGKRYTTKSALHNHTKIKHSQK